MIKLIARIECDKCSSDDDFELNFGDDVEVLYSLSSSTGGGICSNKHLCAKREEENRKEVV